MLYVNHASSMSVFGVVAICIHDYWCVCVCVYVCTLVIVLLHPTSHHNLSYAFFTKYSGGTNIMYDARVVRGSTYAARVVSQAQQENQNRLERERQMRKTKRMRRPANKTRRPPTPEPVPGRKHIDVQTEEYLEELTDRPPERDQITQTDPLMDRPPSPLFVPAKIGRDVSTQIEPGDLFNFAVEVEPILEVLVGKTLEQAMDEVLEEEELANIRKHRAAFEQQRNIELAEVQRLEAEEQRRLAEKVSVPTLTHSHFESVVLVLSTSHFWKLVISSLLLLF